ncbi:MAG: ABC transporter ATP-binding protein [Limnothrix sp. RL_2_0]|nr:ABC transporter ATP-binding protein [Limnothrix sp. RL_2_0]
MLQKFKTTIQSPAYRLIFKTISRNWPLLAVNVGSNILGVLFEGSTLGVIYVAISVLSEGSENVRQVSFFGSILQYFPYDDQYLFLLLLALAVIFQCFLALSQYANKVSMALLSARIQPQVTGAVFRQIMSLSFSCASRYKVGDLVLFANGAAGTVNNQITVLNDVIVNISFVFIYSVILVQLSPLLALIAVILSLALVLVQRILLPRLKRVVKLVMRSRVGLASKMTETIQSLRLVHTFGNQQQAIEGTDNLLLDMEKALKKRGFLFYLSEPILDVLPILALAILAAIAYVLNPESETILPLLLTFLVALQRLATRLRGVSNAATRTIDISADVKRLTTILDSSDKEFALIGSESFKALETDVEFRNIDLSYTNDDVFAIEGLNLVLLKNKVTALVGQSGSGKSSLVDMLIGLYQPTNGDVLANNRSIYDYKQSDWRQRIGVVSQDTVVFNMSIFENLRYGAPDKSLEEVIEVAKAAQAHQFISDLPEGYETIVGERGYRLSGGQRQRLALARALVKDPDILILDEATSALDSQSEKLIQEALDQFQENRTVIVIAHRLSTIVGADQIIVMEQGKIIERGNHQSLIEQDGAYAKAWRLQVAG